MPVEPIVVECAYQATPGVLWKALTDINEIRRWYFQLDEFRAEPGFEFQFTGGPAPDRQYLHICEIREVIPFQKLSYSWRYDGYGGDSLVSFELLDHPETTRVRLTHRGIETLETQHPDFARSNFAAGWSYIIGTALKDYTMLINPANYTKTLEVPVSQDDVYRALTTGIHQWWSGDFSGASAQPGDEFTVRFGNHYKTLKVETISPNKICWRGIQSYIDMPGLSDKNEWAGTLLLWEFTSYEDGSRIQFTHAGLTPELACWDVCDKGWDHFLEQGLRAYLEGSPRS